MHWLMPTSYRHILAGSRADGSEGEARQAAVEDVKDRLQGLE